MSGVVLAYWGAFIIEPDQKNPMMISRPWKKKAYQTTKFPINKKR
jgi:hypothetical protein